MKILYCIPSLDNSGGTERILTEKVNYLINHPDNFEIFIITTEGNNLSPFYKVDYKVKIIELNICFNDVYHLPTIKKYLKTKQKLKLYKEQLETFIKLNQIDICISTGAKEIEFLYKLNYFCKTVCELHFSKSIRKDFLTSRKNGLIWNLLGEIRTMQLINQTKKINKLIVLTKADKKEWNKTNENVSQIYNFSSFKTSENADLINNRVIAIGRLEPQKGFDNLIEAWKLVYKSNKAWELDIYGEGDWEDSLKEKIREYELEKKIHLKGRSSNVQERLLDSSLFVLSSRYEGFPMVLLESLSLGVPVVSFDCKTGPNEIIENNDCGILVENQNIDKLAEAILEMINNYDLRVDKGRKAKLKSNIFSKETIMNQWIDLFKNLYLENKK